MAARKHSSVLYLDTNILIYLLEGHQPFATRIADILATHAEAGGTLVTSVVAITEFGAGTSVSSLTALYSIPRLEFIDVDQPIAEQAVRLQQADSLTIGDALHLATAIGTKAGRFMTNDSRLAREAKAHIKVMTA